MPRVQPTVVVMGHDDVPQVARLWSARRDEAGTATESAQRALSDGRLHDVLTRDYTCVFLAVVDGEVVGYAWTTICPLTAHLDAPSISIDDAYVVPDRRAQGIGRALLAAVAGYAQSHDLDHVACGLPAQARDANRTLARLGFVPLVTRRVTQTSALVRRIHGDDPRLRVDQLLLQRRRRAQRAAVRA